MQDERDRHEQWCVERERFVVLLHLDTLREVTPTEACTPAKVMRDLGFSSDRVQMVLDPLIKAGFLAPAGSSEGLVLTARAREYIEREAGRRRSVRLAEGAAHWPTSDGYTPLEPTT